MRHHKPRVSRLPAMIGLLLAWGAVNAQSPQTATAGGTV